MSLDFSKLRVLDFGRYVAGPYCATLLAYLGADVIRIEKLTGGEDRYIAPLASTGEGGVFLQTGCNKRGMTLNALKPEGREILAKLVATADVVIANLTPQGLKRMGLDYPSLVTIRPDIILTTQTAFGAAGPDAERGGFDGVGQAMSGAMFMTGTPGHPVKAAAPYVDYSTAVLSAFGTLAALIHRERTGVGQHVEASLLGTALAVFNSHLIEQAVSAINRQPSGNRVQTSAPSDVFATRDEQVLAHTVGNALFARWCDLIGEPDWPTDTRFSTDQRRGDHRDLICTRMAQWCQARSSRQALDELAAAGIPSGPVLDLQQALDNPQVAAMGWLAQVSFPGLAGHAPVADMPVKFSHLDAGIQRPPPQLGEHTDEILTELGFGPADIRRLHEARVV